MLDCLKEMYKLEALYPEKVTWVKGMTASSSQEDIWDLLGPILQGEVPDEIEERIRRAELEHRQAIVVPTVEQPDGVGHE